MKPVVFAILAAVLYALMTPVAKLLQISAGPVAQAGLLYLGAGVGMTVIYIIQGKTGIKNQRPSVGREDLKFVLAMIILDMLAPIFLLLGLSMSTPESVSLLNNFEIVATTVLAVMLKGFGSGGASLLLSMIIHEGPVSPVSVCLIMLLGFLAIGLSVYFYVLAQSEIGAARTSACYAVSPFVGVLLSLIIFHQLPGRLFWAALLIMAAGVYLVTKLPAEPHPVCQEYRTNP